MTLELYNSLARHVLLVKKHKYSNRGWTPSEPLTQPYQISTHRCFDVVKPLWGNIHNPSQRGYLEQFINAKEKDYREIFLTIDHRKMTLHAL